MATYKLQEKEGKVYLKRGNSYYAEVTQQVEGCDLNKVELKVDELDANKLSVAFTYDGATKVATIMKGSTQTDDEKILSESAKEQEAESPSEEGKTEETPDEVSSEEPQAGETQPEKPKVDINELRRQRVTQNKELKGDLTTRRKRSKADRLAEWINKRRGIKS